MVSVDLKKVYDTVPSDLMWYCIRKNGMIEDYVSVVKDNMYSEYKISVVANVGKTEEVEIEAGLHQGSVFSFILILDVSTE